MQYSHWGGDKNAPRVSSLGFGSVRFPRADLSDSAGFARCVELVEYAIEKGINYFDVAPTYSNSLAESILGTAFRHSTKKIYVAAKTGFNLDRTADDLLRRVDTSLKALCIDKLEFYHIWSIMSFEQYEETMRPGGLYEGAIQAKERGQIGRICVSVHCRADEALRIVESDIFDGITISMNVMDWRRWLPVLKAAAARKMGVVTMNSLAGGCIPQYAPIFEKLDDSANSVPVKALRFLMSFPEITVALSGMSTKEQIDENCAAFAGNREDIILPDDDRKFELSLTAPLCSGCDYCAPCPNDLIIAPVMQAYNHKLLIESSGAHDERETASEIFARIRTNGADLLTMPRCTGCGECEARCTQKIDIRERFRWLYDTAEQYGYTVENIRARFSELERLCANEEKVAIWPSSQYASKALDFWANPEFEAKCEYFNDSEKMWGTYFRGKIVRRPDELVSLGINIIIITHFKMGDIIYNNLRNTMPDHVLLITMWGGGRTEKHTGCRLVLRGVKEEAVDWFGGYWPTSL